MAQRSSGTVNTGGSSMPPSKQVVVINKTVTQYGRPAAINNTGTGVPGTPKSAGAPTKAPSQTMIVTGGREGVISKDIEGTQDGITHTPAPAGHGSTGPIENGPSVDYDSQQGSRIPADIATAQHRIIVGEQDQQLQDKAGA